VTLVFKSNTCRFKKKDINAKNLRRAFPTLPNSDFSFSFRLYERSWLFFQKPPLFFASAEDLQPEKTYTLIIDQDSGAGENEPKGSEKGKEKESDKNEEFAFEDVIDEELQVPINLNAVCNI